MASLFSWLPQMVDNALSGHLMDDPVVDSRSEQRTTEVLVLTMVPYAAAGVATVLAAWLAARRAKARKRRHTRQSTTNSASSSSRDSSAGGDNNSSRWGVSSGKVGTATAAGAPACSCCLQGVFSMQHLTTNMDQAAVPLLIGAVALLCFTPAYSASPQAAFALLCIALAGGFSANSTMCSEASKVVPTRSAGVGLTLFNLFVALGGLVGPIVTGVLVQALGSFSQAVLLAGVGMGVTGLMAGARGVWEEWRGRCETEAQQSQQAGP